MNSEEEPKDYSRDWSMLLSLNVVTNVSGPIIGSALLLLPVWNYTFALVGLVVIALVYTITVFGVQIRGKNILEIPQKRKLGLSRELLHELKLWKEIARESVPFLIMYFVINWVDMTFFVLGGIFGVELQGNSGMEWIVLIVYNLPSIIATIIIFRSGIYRKKKLYAIFALIISGIFFSLLGFVGSNKGVVIGLIFAGSVAIGFAWPLSRSVLSDLSKRAGPYKKQFMGLYNAIASMACCMAPAIMGLIADSIGYYWMFSIMGVSCIIIGILLLSIVPKRILIKHQKLEAVDAIV
jgi:MFS family permease